MDLPFHLPRPLTGPVSLLVAHLEPPPSPHAVQNGIQSVLSPCSSSRFGRLVQMERCILLAFSDNVACCCEDAMRVLALFCFWRGVLSKLL